MVKNDSQRNARRTQMWASALILVGLLLTLQNAGVIANAWGVFWPLVLVLVGVFLLLPER